ncbi:MAG: class I SAM-dependent methyltransferase [Gammaproteobacteria bacterium]
MKALDVWAKLAAECAPAARFYRSHLCGQGADDARKSVLQQGAADFDSKYTPHTREKARYRSDCYASRDGYMEMHIRQNLAAAQHCFAGGLPQPLLWVDFGCGPMISGLALAEELAAQHPGYQRATAYFGIDASRNMVVKAREINAQYQLFAAARFAVAHARHFDASVIARIAAPALACAKTAVLCCSFVLAPNTLQSHDGGVRAAQALAEAWKAFVFAQPHCAETRVIYLNPQADYFHSNWRAFQHAMLAAHPPDNFHYTADPPSSLRIPDFPNPITLAMLRGIRQ